MSRADAIGAAYLVCASLFIIGLKRLSSPAHRPVGQPDRGGRHGDRDRARRSSTSGSSTYEWIILGALIGGIGGAIGAQRVKMTAMPQMVALFNGFGGGAAALVAFADYHDTVGAPGHVETKIIISILFSAVVGSVSFAGLDDRLRQAPGHRDRESGDRARAEGGDREPSSRRSWPDARTSRPGHESQALLVAVVVVSLVLGVQMVMAIGGADMPVVISLLNAFTGLATASTGFVLSNNVLIIAGTLVGASGSLLTQMMGKAMNRSLANMVFGAFGTAGSVALAEGPGGDRSGPLGERRRHRHHAGVRPPRRDRPRVRPRRGPGAAQRPRAGRPARERAASTCATRSIPWPAGCPGT